ncbi:MAG: xanthine dehydrogenase family protein molybdopterin-binding subunit [Chloroflexi bacterium]|nr:MAG: xanthine dehydrogenase family protein molybdopterin-binding subunit [Chloroflexota bacterium]
MAIRDLDALRVLQDPTYAATLTAEEWEALSTNAEWRHLAEEYADVVRQAVEVPTMAQIAPPAPNLGYQQTDFKVLGTRPPRVQGLGVVSNVGWYTENLNRGGQLFMVTLRSPHPHARVTNIDSADAEKFPGVSMVLHRFNLPRQYQNIKLGSGPPDRLLFPEEVFMVGTPVAVVLADSQDIGDEAMRLIKVDYEILPAAVNFLDAMKAGAPKQWDNNQDGTIVGISKPFVRGDGGGPSFASSDIKIDHVAIKPIEQHVALELTNSLTWWENDRLNMIYTSQGAHSVRAALASALRLPMSQVRVVQQGYVGSGYGYRGSLDLPEIHAAIASRLTGRPVKNVYTRYEDFTTRTHRPTFRNEVHVGVQKDGTITSLQAKIIADVGAQRATASAGAWYIFQMLYKIPNMTLEGVDVMTNRYLSGAYRCVSHPNGTFALETAIEKAAYAVGMDPVEFRLKNINLDGNVDAKLPWSNPGIVDCINMAADKIGWKEKWHAAKAKEVRPGVFHGIGLAAHECSHGAGGEPATGQITLNGDGTASIVSASNEIGGGERTMMKLIAVEALGMAWESVNITPFIDTDLSTDTGGSVAAATKAAADAKKANKPDPQVNPADLTIDGKFVKSTKDPAFQMSISSVVNSTGTTIVGNGVHRNDGRWERSTFAAHAAEVEVDTLMGTVKVLNYVAVHDIGRVINGLGAEQQVEGGVNMSLGSTLYEEMLTDQATGLPLNGNMLDYRVPSIKDVPEKIQVYFPEKPKEYGVFGAHGLGEPPMGPPGATIANAVHNAIGVWFDELPITRTRLAAALKQSA